MRSVFVAAVLGLVFSFPASADSIPVLHYAAYDDYAGYRYIVDTAKGAASLQVSFTEVQPTDTTPMHGSPFVRHTFDATVPGMSFDTAASQIIFMGQVGKVVCATVTEKHTVFGTKLMIRPTGSCDARVKRDVSGITVVFEAK
ncbi:hypothetical protein WDW37_11795 [Bdellovibrionota bacterium FG-1]